MSGARRKFKPENFRLLNSFVLIYAFVMLTKNKLIMKTHLLLLIILCFSLGLKSQIDYSFPQENAVWHALAFQYPDDMDTDEYVMEMFSHKYFIDGDTLIENQTWAKIFFTNQYLGDVGPEQYIVRFKKIHCRIKQSKQNKMRKHVQINISPQQSK